MAHTVLNSKVVYAPFTKKTKDGEESKRFVKIGVRINLDSGQWWFFHFKFGSWTKHTPGPLLTYKSGSPMYESDGVTQCRGEERISRYANETKMIEAFSKCPGYLEMLGDAVADAIAEDAEKRAA